MPTTSQGRFRVQEIGRDDVATACDVIHDGLSRLAAEDPAYHLEVESPERIRAEIDAGERMLALCEGDRAIGVTKIRVDRETGLLHFRRMATRPSRDEDQLCTMLIDGVREEAAALGLAGVSCHVVPSHLRLRYLHDAAGLSIVGEQVVRMPAASPELVLRAESRFAFPTFAVVDLEPSDAAELTDVIRTAWADVRTGVLPPDAMLLEPEERARAMRRGQSAIAVRADGRLLAAVTYRIIPGGILKFSDLSVRPDARGVGWARLLLDALTERAAQGGARWLQCAVLADDRRALSVLARYGLTRTDRGMHADRAGRLVEVVVLRGEVNGFETA